MQKQQNSPSSIFQLTSINSKKVYDVKTPVPKEINSFSKKVEKEIHGIISTITKSSSRKSSRNKHSSNIKSDEKNMASPCVNLKNQGVGIELRRLSKTCTHSKSLKEITANASSALKCGLQPILIEDCTGGAYYLRSPTHRISAVFKPQDEEPFAPNNPKTYVSSTSDEFSPSHGIKNGVAAGDSAIRECAAYLLDKDNFAGVPTTSMATAYHPKFYVNKNKEKLPEDAEEVMSPKIGSLQVYCAHDSSAEDVGCSKFTVSSVHAVGILDIRLNNQDRHSGNLLVQNGKLIPIDHGCCLPGIENLNETDFVWLYWPQAKHPFSLEELEYISCLDPEAEEQLLKSQLNFRDEKAILTLHVCTILLKMAAKSGMTLFEIGKLMTREHFDKPCMLEKLIQETLAKCNSSADMTVDMFEKNEFIQGFKKVLESKLNTLKMIGPCKLIRNSTCYN